jgi:hypothetical protein
MVLVSGAAALLAVVGLLAIRTDVLASSHAASATVSARAVPEFTVVVDGSMLLTMEAAHSTS